MMKIKLSVVSGIIGLLFLYLNCSDRVILEDFYEINIRDSIHIEAYSIDEKTFKDISKNKKNIVEIDLSKFNKCLTEVDYESVYLSMNKYQKINKKDDIYSFSAVFKEKSKLFELTSNNQFLLIVVNDKFKRVIGFAIPDIGKSFRAGFFTIDEVKKITGNLLFERIMKSRINYNVSK
jgi:hypothetical protein